MSNNNTLEIRKAIDWPKIMPLLTSWHMKMELFVFHVFQCSGLIKYKINIDLSSFLFVEAMKIYSKQKKG